MTVINNGVKFDGLEPPSKIISKKSIGLESHQTVLLCVGTLVPNKGHKVLLQSLSILLRNKGAISFQVLFLGDGPIRDEVDAEINKLGLSNYVRILGFKGDVFPYYKAADIVILPTLYEHFPWAVLEAMSVGTPVIASNIGGIPEIIDHEINGLLVPPNDPCALADAMERLMSSSELRRLLGEAARQKVKSKFTTEKMVRETEAVYEKVLKEIR